MFIWSYRIQWVLQRSTPSVKIMFHGLEIHNANNSNINVALIMQTTAEAQQSQNGSLSAMTNLIYALSSSE